MKFFLWFVSLKVPNEWKYGVIVKLPKKEVLLCLITGVAVLSWKLPKMLQKLLFQR